MKIRTQFSIAALAVAALLGANAALAAPETAISIDKRIARADLGTAPSAALRSQLMEAAASAPMACGLEPAQSTQSTDPVQHISRHLNGVAQDKWVQGAYHIVLTEKNVSPMQVYQLIELLGQSKSAAAANDLRKIYGYAPVLAERLVSTDIDPALIEPSRNSTTLEIREAVLRAINRNKNTDLADVVQNAQAEDSRLSAKATAIMKTW